MGLRRIVALALATLAVIAFGVYRVLPLSQSSVGLDPSGCMEIRAARWFDARAGIYRSPARIIIRGDRIDQILSTETATSPSCAVLDLSSATLLPGLIDAHTHLFLRDNSYYSDFSKELLRNVQTSASKRIEWARQSAREFVLGGITSVRDLGNSGLYLDVDFRNSVEREAQAAPRLFVSGPGLSGQEGQFDPGTPLLEVRKEYHSITTEEAAASAIQDARARGVDWIKVFADGDPNPESMSQELLSTVVRTARALGLKIAAHATTEESASRAIAGGADSIEHGFELSTSALQSMAKKRIFLVPTDISRRLCGVLAGKTTDPQFRDTEALIAKRGARLREAFRLGVPIAFGSDAYADLSSDGVSMVEAAKEALYSYVDEGMDTRAALQAATVGAAELLGKTGVLGVLEPGALADIIAVNGDPLANLRDLDHVVFVMKSGLIIKKP